MEIAQGRKTLNVDRDEHARPQTTMEILAKLPPVFKKDGVVTAGNASGICDGAAMLVVVDGEWGKAQGMKPLAKLIQWGVAGVEPSLMGIGPAPAIRSALDRAGLALGDVDLFDVKEPAPSSWPSRRAWPSRGRPTSTAALSPRPLLRLRRPHHHEPGLHAEEARKAPGRGLRLHRRGPGPGSGARGSVARG
jgi:hypothetical protein